MAQLQCPFTSGRKTGVLCMIKEERDNTCRKKNIFENKIFASKNLA